MLEAALVPHVVDKASYKTRENELRRALLDGQFELHDSRNATIVVVIAGLDGSGKAEVVYRLYEWMDVHFLETHAFGTPDAWVKRRPTLWRYWQVLPQRGHIGIVLGSWYHEPIARHLAGKLDDAGLEDALAALNRFEAMLSAEGVVLLKIWLHTDKDTRRERIAESQAGRRVVMNEWDGDGAKQATRVIEQVLLRTSTAHAPWHAVASFDTRYRDLTVGELLRDVLAAQAEASRPLQPSPLPSSTPPPAPMLASLDLDRHLAKADYQRELDAYQTHLRRLVSRRRFSRGKGLVVVFEGTDAAGKGGAIRRITACLDPRQFRVHPIGAPSDEELAHPYLWRFWRRLPLPGQSALFDRSWYGRVLVERVDALIPERDWRRAYDEINDFERQLSDSGMIIVKFWLAISKDEQLARFQARQAVEFKRFKLGDADWHARAQWDAYQTAADEMIARTSTEKAPWAVVAADDKRWARVQVLKTLCERLDGARTKD